MSDEQLFGEKGGATPQKRTIIIRCRCWLILWLSLEEYYPENGNVHTYVTHPLFGNCAKNELHVVMVQLPARHIMAQKGHVDFLTVKTVSGNCD